MIWWIFAFWLPFSLLVAFGMGAAIRRADREDAKWQKEQIVIGFDGSQEDGAVVGCRVSDGYTFIIDPGRDRG